MSSGPRWFFALILGLVISGRAEAQDCTDLYNPEQVLNLYITVAPADWDALIAYCPGGKCPEKPESGHTYWPGQLQCQDTTPISVGVRRKMDPAAPSESNPQKVSLKIDINRYVPGQTFARKSKLSLECGSDSSVVTEGFSWQMYQAATVVASRSAWVKVWVNGTYRGLYSNVEVVDKNFFDDHGFADGGFVYKIEEQRTREAEANPFAFNWYPFDHPTYIPEVSQPADWRTQARWRVDMPQLLKFAAVENYIANSDGTLNQMHNYHYYDWSILPNDDPAGQQPRLYLPWDLDTCFKRWDTTLPVLGSGGGSLRAGILQDTVFGPEYLDAYQQVLEGGLAASNTMRMASRIESVIAPAFDADPNHGQGTAAAEFQTMRDYLKARSTYLLAELGLCGNGVCDAGEDSCVCPTDCGPPATTETSCTDGVDNDCDTLIDCYDADCGSAQVCICLDQDGDGYGQGPQCLGPDCDDTNPLVNPAQSEICGDGLDNDCDGSLDCLDSTCAVQAACETPVILNEYNAVDPDQYLEGSGSDVYWGRVFGNGGDWFELVVIHDHLDMRGWQLSMVDAPGDPVHNATRTLTLSTHAIWSDLRSGTIITVAEDLPSDISYNPCGGDWWIHVQANGLAGGLYITAHDFPVSNRNWRLSIRNAQGQTVFGPAGEGIYPVTGVGGDEVFKLEADPGPHIHSLSNYNDGSSSTFGAPNRWNAGTVVQNFSDLRTAAGCASLVPFDLDNDGDVDADDLLMFVGCGSGPNLGHDGTARSQQADRDQDGDVDSNDFAGIQRCFSGAGQSPPAGCAD
jgi:spore coat protein CotH